MPELTQTKTGGIITWTPADWLGGLDAQGQFSNMSVIKKTDKFGWQYLNCIDPFQKYGVLSPGFAPNVYSYTSTNPLTGAIVASQINGMNLYGVTNTGLVTSALYQGATPSIVQNANYPHTITGLTPIGQDLLIYTHNFNKSLTVSLFYVYANPLEDGLCWNIGINQGFQSGNNFIDSYLYNGTGAGAESSLQIMSGTVSVSTNTVTGVGTLFTQSVSVGDMFVVTGHNGALVTSINSDTSLTLGTSLGTVSSTTWTYFPNANDYSSTQSNPIPHPLCIGSDGIMYIGDGNYLHGYDGSVGSYGTFYQKVLSFQPNIQITGLVQYNATLLISANDILTNQAFVYIWDYNDLNTTTTIPLEDATVSAIFIYKGTPAVITTGIRERNGNNKIKFITGISTTKIADFDGIAPTQRGVLVADTVVYLNAGGKILSCGDRFNPKSYAINNISNCNLTGSSGFISYNSYNSVSTGNVCLMASGGNSINNFDNQGISAGVANASSFQIPFPPRKVGKIKEIQVNFYSGIVANVSNGSLKLELATDYQSPAVTVFTGLNSVVAPNTKKYLNDSSNNPFPQFTSIAPRLTWTASTVGAPLVSSIILEYDELELPDN